MGSKLKLSPLMLNASTLPSASSVPLPDSINKAPVINASGTAARISAHGTKQSIAQMSFGSALDDHQRASALRASRVCYTSATTSEFSE